jgi:hypothetical protein
VQYAAVWFWRGEMHRAIDWWIDLRPVLNGRRRYNRPNQGG